MEPALKELEGAFLTTGMISSAAILALADLIAELEVHHAEIASHGLQIKVKTTAIKEIVGSLEKEV